MSMTVGEFKGLFPDQDDLKVAVLIAGINYFYIEVVPNSIHLTSETLPVIRAVPEGKITAEMDYLKTGMTFGQLKNSLFGDNDCEVLVKKGLIRFQIKKVFVNPNEPNEKKKFIVIETENTRIIH